jgi:hypothetical protein
VKISIDLTNFSESIASILEQLSNVFSAQSRVSEEFVLKYLGFVTLEERDSKKASIDPQIAELGIITFSLVMSLCGFLVNEGTLFGRCW